MPKISFDVRELFSLLGRTLDKKLLEAILENAKCEIEGWEGDVLTVEVTADRPDMFSVEGLARALKGLLGIERGLPDYEVVKPSRQILVDRSVIRVRPYVAGLIVRNVKFTDEALAHIMQFQEKLHQTLCRDRRKASIGLYDLSKVEGNIRYLALPLNDIRFRPLESEIEMSGPEILSLTEKGRRYAHLVGELAPLLVDSKGTVLSMPPIINSEDTKVTEETKDIFIDATGFDYEFVSSVAALVALNLAERAGSVEPVPTVYIDGKILSPRLEPFEIEMPIEMPSSILGMQLEIDEMFELMERMRLSPRLEEGKIKVKVPPYRLDVLHPVDIIEDIAIAYGYNNIEPVLPVLQTRGGELPIRKFERFLAEMMVGLGFQEILNYMMTSPSAQIYKMRLDESLRTRMVEVENPLSLEYSALRIWLLPCVLGFLSYNLKAPYPQKVFEIGHIVERDGGSETLTRQEVKMCAAISQYAVSFEEIQSALYALLAPLRLEPTLKPISHSSFIEGRVASIEVDGEDLGIIGEIHPEVLLNFGLKNPVAAFELSVEELFKVYNRK